MYMHLSLNQFYSITGHTNKINLKLIISLFPLQIYIICVLIYFLIRCRIKCLINIDIILLNKYHA